MPRSTPRHARLLAATSGLIGAAFLVTGCVPIEPVEGRATPHNHLERVRNYIPSTPTPTPIPIPTITKKATPVPTAVRRPTPTPSATTRSCRRWWNRGVNAQITVNVTPGTGSAQLEWPHTGDPDILGFRVAAVPDYQLMKTGTMTQPISYQEVVTTPDCRPIVVHTSITGLIRGERYKFWLVAKSRRLDGGPGIRNRQVGRSAAYTIA